MICRTKTHWVLKVVWRNFYFIPLKGLEGYLDGEFEWLAPAGIITCTKKSSLFYFECCSNIFFLNGALWSAVFTWHAFCGSFPLFLLSLYLWLFWWIIRNLFIANRLTCIFLFCWVVSLSLLDFSSYLISLEYAGTGWHLVHCGAQSNKYIHLKNPTIMPIPRNHGQVTQDNPKTLLSWRMRVACQAN